LACAEGPVKVAILAGGLGTRLGALAADLPKPMIEVGGKPFLEHVIRSFADCGFREFVLLTGHRGEAVERHFGDGKQLGVTIAYNREREPIGTGGAVREARALLGDRFVLTYGDVFRRFDYDRFVAHNEARLAVYPRIAEGNTRIDAGRVVEFNKSKPQLPYVDAGFCVMPSSVIDLLPAKGSFEEVVFRELAGRRELAGEIVNHDFVEIGTPEALAHARLVLA
jgi:NDP-sugar pyrophosphorylase family protein